MKKKTFKELSRHQKKRKFIRVKNTVKSQSAYFGDVFSTYDVISDGTSWADICFISKRHKNCFYNAVIDTAAYHYKEHLENLSFEAAEQLFKDNAPEHLKNSFYENSCDVKDRKGFEQVYVKCFGGKSKKDLYAWQDKWVEDCASKGLYPVKPMYKKNFTYRHGVGLHIVVNAPSLTRQVIIDAVNYFYNNKEQEEVFDIELSFNVEQLRSVRSSNAVSEDVSTWAGAFKEQTVSENEKVLLEQLIDVKADSRNNKSL